MRALSSRPALPRFCRPLELHLKACSDSKAGTKHPSLFISAGEGILLLFSGAAGGSSRLNHEVGRGFPCGLRCGWTKQRRILLGNASEDRGLPVPIPGCDFDSHTRSRQARLVQDAI